IITRTDDGLRLKHDHRDEQGVIHGYHMYGGDTAEAGTAARQELPVDRESIEQFVAGGAQVPTTNVCAVEVRPGRVCAAEVRRPGGWFMRGAFALTGPAAESDLPGSRLDGRQPGSSQRTRRGTTGTTGPVGRDAPEGDARND